MGVRVKVVGMQMGDHLTGRRFDAGIHGPTDAPRDALQHAGLRAFARDQFKGAVGRATVDKQVLGVAMRLGLHRADRVGQRGHTVPGAGDDAEFHVLEVPAICVTVALTR